MHCTAKQVCSCLHLSGFRSETKHGTLLYTRAAIGFNVETVTYKNIKFQVWDLGGQTSIRPYWRCYYPYAGVAL